MAEGQRGNVTASEPINLVVGKNDSGAETISGSFRADIILGRGGNDTIDDGDERGDTVWADDTLIGGAGSDTFKPGKGNDIIWGGDKDATANETGATDIVDYSSITTPITVSCAGSTMTVSAGSDGTDTLHWIEQITGTASSTDCLALQGTGANALFDLTDLDGNDFALKSQDGTEVRFKSFEKFVGGESLTTFIGKAGTPAEFRAGEGGGDFTLKSGDRAYGYDGVQDTFRVTATIPDELASATTAEKIDYLRQNRVFIGNFGNEDRIYVNGTLFTGNTVTSTLAPNKSFDANDDIKTSYAMLSGTSSYGTAYAQAAFDQQGLSITNQPWGSYLYSAGAIRDVAFHKGDDDGTGVISFMARTITPDDDAPLPGYMLDPLSATDEMLSIVIDGFSDGEGGVSFANDNLANFNRPTVYDTADEAFHTYTGETTFDQDGLKIQVGPDNDMDGDEDGYLAAGGATTDSDEETFNNGYLPFGEDGTEWDDYVLGAERMSGGEGGDTLDGGAGNDTLFGEDGDDTLIGGPGDDWLDGGDGADTMIGGTGNDTYVVDDENDVVVENEDEGTDTIRTMMASFTLSGWVEGLSFFGPGTFTGTGNDLDNILTGGEGDDTLSGGLGDDSFLSSEGTNVLNGGDGTDALVINGGQYSISISESGGTYSVTDLGLSDSVNVLNSVERVFLTSIGDSFTIAELLDPSVTGTNGDDEMLDGNGLDNEIFGLEGDDVLRGGRGYDTLDGGDGLDIAWFIGAAVDYDVYIDPEDGSLWAEDLVGDEFIDQLIDIEAIYFASEDETYTIGDLVGYFGTTGNDALIEASERDNWLYGLAGDDVLHGLGGNDVIDGGAGADAMVGGAGNDVYLVDDSGDVVAESAAGGYDTVYTSINCTLTDHVDRLAVNGVSTTTALSLTGNSLANEISGNEGGNIIDGGGGADLMFAYGGNDFYVVDNVGDVVIELSGGGLDTIWSSVGFTLEHDIERLGVNGFTTTYAIDLTGNELGNEMWGNDGANLIDGKAGSDIIYGFAGADTFRFTTALGSGNVDQLVDFTAGTDTIALDDAIFTGLATGALAAGAFRAGTAAQDADDRIIYDSTMGYLYFDADGNGSGAAVHFATVHDGTSLAAGDFTVI